MDEAPPRVLEDVVCTASSFAQDTTHFARSLLRRSLRALQGGPAASPPPPPLVQITPTLWVATFDERAPGRGAASLRAALDARCRGAALLSASDDRDDRLGGRGDALDADGRFDSGVGCADAKRLEKSIEFSQACLCFFATMRRARQRLSVFTDILFRVFGDLFSLVEEVERVIQTLERGLVQSRL